jgi:hypothetical protein
MRRTERSVNNGLPQCFLNLAIAVMTSGLHIAKAPGKDGNRDQQTTPVHRRH